MMEIAKKARCRWCRLKQYGKGELKDKNFGWNYRVIDGWMDGWAARSDLPQAARQTEGKRRGDSRTCEARREAAVGFILWLGATPASGLISAECSRCTRVGDGTGQSR